MVAVVAELVVVHRKIIFHAVPFRFYAARVDADARVHADVFVFALVSLVHLLVGADVDGGDVHLHGFHFQAHAVGQREGAAFYLEAAVAVDAEIFYLDRFVKKPEVCDKGIVGEIQFAGQFQKEFFVVSAHFQFLDFYLKKVFRFYGQAGRAIEKRFGRDGKIAILGKKGVYSDS